MEPQTEKSSYSPRKNITNSYRTANKYPSNVSRDNEKDKHVTSNITLTVLGSNYAVVGSEVDYKPYIFHVHFENMTLADKNLKYTDPEITLTPAHGDIVTEAMLIPMNVSEMTKDERIEKFGYVGGKNYDFDDKALRCHVVYSSSAGTASAYFYMPVLKFEYKYHLVVDVETETKGGKHFDASTYQDLIYMSGIYENNKDRISRQVTCGTFTMANNSEEVLYHYGATYSKFKFTVIVDSEYPIFYNKVPFVKNASITYGSPVPLCMRKCKVRRYVDGRKEYYDYNFRGNEYIDDYYNTGCNLKGNYSNTRDFGPESVIVQEPIDNCTVTYDSFSIIGECISPLRYCGKHKVTIVCDVYNAPYVNTLAEFERVRVNETFVRSYNSYDVYDMTYYFDGKLHTRSPHIDNTYGYENSLSIITSSNNIDISERELVRCERTRSKLGFEFNLNGNPERFYDDTTIFHTVMTDDISLNDLSIKQSPSGSYDATSFINCKYEYRIRNDIFIGPYVSINANDNETYCVVIRFARDRFSEVDGAVCYHDSPYRESLQPFSPYYIFQPTCSDTTNTFGFFGWLALSTDIRDTGSNSLYYLLTNLLSEGNEHFHAYTMPARGVTNPGSISGPRNNPGFNRSIYEDIDSKFDSNYLELGYLGGLITGYARTRLSFNIFGDGKRTNKNDVEDENNVIDVKHIANANFRVHDTPSFVDPSNPKQAMLNWAIACADEYAAKNDLTRGEGFKETI